MNVAEAKFNEAIEKVFARWTTLALAVEQGWGGRDSRAKAQQLKAEIIEHLANGSRKKRPPTHENIDDVEDLAHLLYLRIDELFNAEADDGSSQEVAGLCLRLFNTCKAGDTSFAEQLLQACQAAPPADLSKCQGMDRVQYATDEDQLLDQMEGMELEEGSSESGDEDVNTVDMVEEGTSALNLPGSSGYQDAPQEPKAAPPEPEVDEDGFTSVVKGKRRPR
mmetsp:Transcript_60929/g.108226  ORF Transcript_60929/g.108226 Transcript_60929/m.108226 type:complete len:222 (-) Transcript_60929:62-727(-)